MTCHTGDYPQWDEDVEEQERSLPVIGVGLDQELRALVDAARIVVDNHRSGPLCCYRDAIKGHGLGSLEYCAVCALYVALRPYTD